MDMRMDDFDPRSHDSPRTNDSPRTDDSPRNRDSPRTNASSETDPLRSPSRGTYVPPSRRRPAAPPRTSEGATAPPRPAHPHLVLTRRGRRVALEAVAMLASTVLVMSLPGSLQATGPWSQPVALAPCSAPGVPAVLFPSDEPRHATGPGAIVWGAGSSCGGGAGARVSAIVPGGDAPGPETPARGAGGTTLALAPPIAAQTAPHGRILVAGTYPAAESRAGERPEPGRVGRARAESSRGGRGRAEPGRMERARPAGGLLLSEGSAEGPFTTPQATGGAVGPLALTSAYLGDVALVSPGGPDAGTGGASRIELRVHRYYARAFSPPVAVTPTEGDGGDHAAAGDDGGRVEDLTVAMDYRSDALVVWERAGAIYARDMPGSGRSSRAAVRVAGAEPGARISGLLSDDNRAILAWSETRAGVTSIWAELSGTGPRFGRPWLVERFTDPSGLQPMGGGGAPRLVRLSSESVMLAWSGVTAGRWVVHTAAIDENGVRAIATISPPGHEALLADLAPGPAGEAYALWSEPRAVGGGVSAGGGASGGVASGGRLEYDDQALYAARGIDAYPGRTIFDSPQLVAAAGADGTDGEAAVGVDPDSDRAVAAWRTSGGAIEYSLRSVGGTGG